MFPEEIIVYFDGLLENLGSIHYAAYYQDGHYYLIYDLDVSEGVPVPGEYPVVDLVFDSTTNSYSRIDTTTSTLSFPDVYYGSFGSASEFRTGMGYTETYVILFAIGFSVVFAVVSGIFNTVLNLGRK